MGPIISGDSRALLTIVCIGGSVEVSGLDHPSLQYSSQYQQSAETFVQTLCDPLRFKEAVVTVTRDIVSRS
jgi:hypothetical protein